MAEWKTLLWSNLANFKEQYNNVVKNAKDKLWDKIKANTVEITEEDKKNQEIFDKQLKINQWLNIEDKQEATNTLYNVSNSITPDAFKLTPITWDNRTTPMVYPSSLSSLNMNNELWQQNQILDAYNNDLLNEATNLMTETSRVLNENKMWDKTLESVIKEMETESDKNIFRTSVANKLSSFTGTVTSDLLKTWDEETKDTIDQINDIYKSSFEWRVSDLNKMQDAWYLNAVNSSLNTLKLWDESWLAQRTVNALWLWWTEEEKAADDFHYTYDKKVIIDGNEYDLLKGTNVLSLYDAISDWEKHDIEFSYKINDNIFGSVIGARNDKTVTRKITEEDLNTLGKVYSDWEKDDPAYQKYQNRKAKLEELYGNIWLEYVENDREMDVNKELHKIQESQRVNVWLTIVKDTLNPLFDKAWVWEIQKAELLTYITKQLTEQSATLQNKLNVAYDIQEKYKNWTYKGWYANKLKSLDKKASDLENIYNQYYKNYAEYLAIKSIYWDDDVKVNEELVRRWWVDPTYGTTYDFSILSNFLTANLWEPKNADAYAMYISAWPDVANILDSFLYDYVTDINKDLYENNNISFWQYTLRDTETLLTLAGNGLNSFWEWALWIASMGGVWIADLFWDVNWMAQYANAIAAWEFWWMAIWDNFEIDNSALQAFYSVSSVVPEVISIFRGNAKLDKLIDFTKGWVKMWDYWNKLTKLKRWVSLSKDWVRGMEMLTMKRAQTIAKWWAEFVKNYIQDWWQFNRMDTSSWDYDEQSYWSNIGWLISLWTSWILWWALWKVSTFTDDVTAKIVRSWKNNVMHSTQSVDRWMRENPEKIWQFIAWDEWDKLSSREKAFFSIAVTDSVEKSTKVLNMLKESDPEMNRMVSTLEKGYVGTMLDSLLSKNNNANRQFILEAANDAWWDIPNLVKRLTNSSWWIEINGKLSNLFTKADASLLQSVSYNRWLDIISDWWHFLPTQERTLKEITEFWERWEQILPWLKKVFSEEWSKQFFKKSWDKFVLNTDWLTALWYTNKKLNAERIWTVSKDTEDFCKNLEDLNNKNTDVWIELVPQNLINDIRDTDAFDRVSSMLWEYICS